MRRVTYEVLAAHSSGENEVSRLTMAAPKAVISNTLQGPPAWADTGLPRGDAETAIAAIKREAGAPIRTIGSLGLVRRLLKHNLVDRLRLLVFPLILGDAGSQLTSLAINQKLLDHGINAAIGRVATACDNALMGSTTDPYKSELIHAALGS